MASPPPFPPGWVSEVVLTDGGTVRLRPLISDDDEAVLRFFHRLSENTIYLRFFTPMPRVTASMLERVVDLDYDDRFALVAELGGEIVALARYDRSTDPAEAEVAFTVQDDQQGRGLATIMLEHLAEIARANGIHRFVASTLPENRKMLGVFRDAGFEIDRSFGDGMVEVTFPIEPTESSVRAMRDRERVAEARSIARILEPRSVAVIGAGRTPGTIGHEVFRNLIEYGFEGPVYPINDHAGYVASVHAYRSILDVPEDVDLAVIAVPAEAVAGVVEDCARKRVRGLVVVSSGFAETGADGAATERALLATARRHGMRLIGPNSMGVVNTNPAVRLLAAYAPVQPTRGRIGFLTQSGALGVAVLERARRLGLGLSSFVSVGNKADVSGNDLLQYWADDPDTDVILLYLESFGNPRKFGRLARRIALEKPIVVVRSGRSEAGTRAVESHTGTLAPREDVVDALLGQAGVIRVDSIEELFPTAQMLVHQPLPSGRRVAIVSNGGGPGILAADACEAVGLEVPLLSRPSQAALRTFLPFEAAVRNPVDLAPGARAEDYERAVRIVLADGGIDALIVICTPILGGEPAGVARAISSAAAEAGGKPVAACFLGVETLPDALAMQGGEAAAVPTYAFPEAAARALGHAARLAAWRARPQGNVPDLDDLDIDAARALVERALDALPEGGPLEPDDACALARMFGIAIAEAPPDSTGAESGVEVIVGVRQDPQFGPLVLFELAGPDSDTRRDRALRILPLTDQDARDLVRSLSGSPLLSSRVSAELIDADALEQLLIRVGCLADELPEVAELDCNPVIVSPDGAVVAEVHVRLAPVVPQPPPLLRRLRDTAPVTP